MQTRLFPAAAVMLLISCSPDAERGRGGDTGMAGAGAEFDRAFIQHEISDHQTSIQRIETQLLPAAEAPRIKEYLQTTLTEMKGHLASLQQVQQQLAS